VILLHPWAALLGLLVAGMILLLARRLHSPVLRVPTVLFVPEASAPPARAPFTPPLSAWLAAAAAGAAGLAAADPRSEGEDLTIQVDADASMARANRQGETRLERARREAIERIAGAAHVRWAIVPGSSGEGLPAQAEAALSQAAEAAYRTAAQAPRAPAVWLSGSQLQVAGGVEVHRLGASDVNVGIVGWVPPARGAPARVVAANGGGAPARSVLRAGALDIPIDLAAGEARAVPVPSDGWTETRLTPAPGESRDAFSLDDAVAVPPSGLRLDLSPRTPEPLRRALEAVVSRLPDPGRDSPVLACRPLEASEPASGARIEFATSGFRLRGIRGLEGTVASEISLPAQAPCVPVDVDEAWLVATDGSEPIAGRSGATARIGLDLSDAAIAASPALPILVAALVEAVAAAPLLRGGDPAPFDATLEGPLRADVLQGERLARIGLYRAADGRRFSCALLDPVATTEAGAREDSREGTAGPAAHSCSWAWLASSGAAAAALAAAWIEVGRRAIKPR
jgi:hypothetical protein